MKHYWEDQNKETATKKDVLGSVRKLTMKQPNAYRLGNYQFNYDGGYYYVCLIEDMCCRWHEETLIEAGAVPHREPSTKEDIEEIEELILKNKAICDEHESEQIEKLKTPDTTQRHFLENYISDMQDKINEIIDLIEQLLDQRDQEVVEKLNVRYLPAECYFDKGQDVKNVVMSLIDNHNKLSAKINEIIDHLQKG